MNDEEYKVAWECYTDELKDVIKYTDMYKKSTNSLHKQFYNDIAHDEFNHAKILKHMLVQENKYSQTDEIKKLEDEVENTHNMFL